MNLTSVPFNNQESNLIEKGFKFNLPPSNLKKAMENIGVDGEVILNNYKKFNDISSTDINTEKHVLANKIKNLQLNCATTPYDALIKSIKQKTIENNLIFTKADKGNTVIAMHKNEYKEKTLVFLDKYEIASGNPTYIFQKDVKKAIKKCSFLDELDYFNLTVMNPQPPKLYSLVKLHKEGNPIRPVVSFVSAPSVKLSKRLIEIIKFHTNFNPTHSIRNSLELTQKIKDLHIPNNAILLSFDVKNLFPSVPPSAVLSITKKLLINNKVDPQLQSDIIDLYEICLN